MKSMKPALIALVVTATLGSALPASAADLAEVYQRALRSDPQLREAEANRLATLERRPQALANLLPNLNATGSWTTEDTELENTLGTVDPGSGSIVFRPLASTIEGDTTQWQVQLRQTLFRWEQFAQYRRAGTEVAQAELDYRDAQQDVIVRAAAAYFNVLAARDTLEAGEAAREAIARQLEQAEKRFEVGLIAITDVQEAQAGNDQANATLIEAKRALATSRERLRELTGDLFDVLERPGDDMPLVSPDPAKEEDWVKAALDQNLALQSARLGAEIARENISIARGGHFPNVDLVASRGGFDANLDRTIGAGTESPADASNDETLLGVQVTFPIYSGGATSSRVREAVYRQRAARERLERTARETERQTRDSYLNVLSGIARVQALRQAVQSNQTALQATEAGYEVGTRTAVDVLTARQRLFSTQTEYARARYDYVLSVLALERAVGTLDETRVARVNGWLQDPVPVK